MNRGTAVDCAALCVGMATALPSVGVASDETLDEIVVTASRREQSLLEVPAAVSTIDAGQIEARGALKLSEALVRGPSSALFDSAPGHDSC